VGKIQNIDVYNKYWKENGQEKLSFISSKNEKLGSEFGVVFTKLHALLHMIQQSYPLLLIQMT
jgi:hypothetical protein